MTSANPVPVHIRKIRILLNACLLTAHTGDIKGFNGWMEFEYRAEE
jgi:hypothetical protein